MNVHNFLISQGWRGKGHTLHAHDNAVGLSKPLYVSRKDDKQGLGQKAHHTSDQWWLDAFDEKLKGLESNKEGIVQTVTYGKLNTVAPGMGKYMGLYTSFVKGGLLEGTLTPDDEGSESSSSSDEVDAADAKARRKAEKEARKEARRIRRAKKESSKGAGTVEGTQTPTSTDEAQSTVLPTETKEERKARRAASRARKEERRLRREAKAQRKNANG